MRRGAFHGRNRTQSPPFYFSLLMKGGTVFAPWARVATASGRYLRGRVSADRAFRITFGTTPEGGAASAGDRLETDRAGGRIRRNIHITGSTRSPLAGPRAVEQIRHRPDVLLFEVTRRNRDSIAEVILKNIGAVPAGEKRRALRSAERKDRTGRKKSTV